MIWIILLLLWGIVGIMTLVEHFDQYITPKDWTNIHKFSYGQMGLLTLIIGPAWILGFLGLLVYISAKACMNLWRELSHIGKRD